MTKLKIATYNANSIRVRLDQILDWLQREATDILCIQETKVQDKDFPLTPIQEAGYHVIFKGQKSYSGVAIISREAPQDVDYGLEGQDEPRLIRTVIQGISVVNTYIPQGRDAKSEHFQYKLDWLAKLRSFFEKHYTPTQPLVWVGDFNIAPEDIDVYDPKALQGHVDFHPEAKAALEKIRAWGFVDVFRKHHPDEPKQFTYWDYRARNPIERGRGWRVDHIWATEVLAKKSTKAWIDVEARRAERPSDHTFLVGEFSR